MVAPVAILSLSVLAISTQLARPAGTTAMVYVYGAVPPAATTCIISVSAAVFSATLAVAADEKVSAASVKKRKHLLL